MRLTEIIRIRNAELAQKKAKAERDKANNAASEAAERASNARRRQTEEAAREQHLRRMGIAMHVYQASGAEALLKEAEKPLGATIELVWDAEKEQYGQRIIWDKKIHGKPRGEHYMHPGGFFTPGWDWGPKIGEFRGKAVTVTADAAHPDRIEVRGRWRRWRVDVTDQEKLDRVLGKAFAHPMKFRRVERVK